MRGRPVRRGPAKYAAIDRHQMAVPPSAAPAHWLSQQCVPFSVSRRGHPQMFPKPKSVLVPNTYAYESEPMVKATGFREYDARWLFGSAINLMGVEALGLGLGTLVHELGVEPRIVTGHDFRSYSASIKLALTNGLVAAGCKVYDIGLAVT